MSDDPRAVGEALTEVQKRLIESAWDREMDARGHVGFGPVHKELFTAGFRSALAAAPVVAQPAAEPTVTEKMVNRFLCWPLPKTFGPDGGVSFDGRGKDAMGYEKQWPIGTNLLTATEARAMLEHVLAVEPPGVDDFPPMGALAAAQPPAQPVGEPTNEDFGKRMFKLWRSFVVRNFPVNQSDFIEYAVAIERDVRASLAKGQP